jgi:hypothetical protein
LHGQGWPRTRELYWREVLLCLWELMSARTLWMLLWRRKVVRHLTRFLPMMSLAMHSSCIGCTASALAAPLLHWLSEHGTDKLHACLEATGTWASGAALALHEAGHAVTLVNPAGIHAFAKSQLKRTKTDKIDKADAILIALFVRCIVHLPGHLYRLKSSSDKGLSAV